MPSEDDTKAVIGNSTDFNTTFVGTHTSRLGVEDDVGIHDDDRLKHVLSVGQTGTGKTQLLTHAALQDAYKGHGFVVIVPKGNAIDEIIAKLPQNRRDDVVYINPGHNTVTPINVLEPYVTDKMTNAQVEHQREIIVSDIIDLFRRQSENWGDRFGRVLATLLRAHVALNVSDNAGKTLIDVYRAITDNTVLTDLINRTDDPVLRNDLATVKDELTDRELEPVQRRLQDFVENRTVRNVIAPEESGVNFRDAIDNQRIVLVDVEKGEVGTTVSRLVGSIVVTKVWAAAQSRITLPAEDRHPFYLYVDEVQNYAGDASSFATVLGEAREYGLGCWLATQYLNKLDTRMRRAVTNNCRTKIVFDPTGSEDLTQLSQMIRGIPKHQLLNLGDYRAVVQTPSTGAKQDAVVIDTYPPWNADHTTVETVKDAAVQNTADTETVDVPPNLGNGANAGGDTHQELLTAAKSRLEKQDGVTVDLLYQDAGADEPDGHVHFPDGDMAHLEAEHGTLSKPGKALANLKRAAEQGRRCLFVVGEENVEKLERILADPVNRQRDEYADETGTYDYYRRNGEVFTDIAALNGAEYDILTVELDTDGSEESPDAAEEEAATDDRQLDEKSRTVLRCIAQGKDDTQKITAATSLDKSAVNYRFQKLHDLDLITVEKPDGKVERVIDGRRYVFDAPKQAALTEEGDAYVCRNIESI